MPKTWQGFIALALTLMFGASVAYGSYLQYVDDQLNQRVADTQGASELLQDGANLRCGKSLETYLWACGATIRLTHGDTGYVRYCGGPDTPRFVGTLADFGTWDFGLELATPMTPLGDCDTGDNCQYTSFRGGMTYAESWLETPPDTLSASLALPDAQNPASFADDAAPQWAALNGQPLSVRIKRHNYNQTGVGPPYVLLFRTQHPALPIGIEIRFTVDPDVPADWQATLQSALDGLTQTVAPPPKAAICPIPPQGTRFKLDALDDRQKAIDLANWLAAQR